MPAAGEPAPSRQPDGDGDAEPTRILIVEDHRVVAKGAALINDQKDMRVAGTVGSVAECVAAALELEPDIVMLDCRLPMGRDPTWRLRFAASVRGAR